MEPVSTREQSSTITEETGRERAMKCRDEQLGWQIPLVDTSASGCWSHQQIRGWEEQNRGLLPGSWGGTFAQRGPLRSELPMVFRWGCFPTFFLYISCISTIISLWFTWHRGPGALGGPFYRGIDCNQGLHAHDLITHNTNTLGVRISTSEFERALTFCPQHSAHADMAEYAFWLRAQRRFPQINFAETGVEPPGVPCLRSRPSLCPFPIHTQLCFLPCLIVASPEFSGVTQHTMTSLLWCCCWWVCYFSQPPGSVQFCLSSLSWFTSSPAPRHQERKLPSCLGPCRTLVSPHICSHLLRNQHPPCTHDCSMNLKWSY